MRATLLAALVLVLIATLSRSALAGLAAGVIFLGARYRRRLLTRAITVPAASVVATLALAVAVSGDFSARVISSRLSIYSEGRLQHLHVYERLSEALAEHPFVGVGLNNYALTYAPRVDDRVEASLSFYVQSLVESGVVGTAVFVAFFVYVLHRLHVLHRIAQVEGSRDGLSLETLASGLTAALIGTLVANIGYQTMLISYFYAFLILAIAAPAKGVPALTARVQNGSDRQYQLSVSAPAVARP